MHGSSKSERRALPGFVEMCNGVGRFVTKMAKDRRHPALQFGWQFHHRNQKVLPDRRRIAGVGSTQAFGKLDTATTLFHVDHMFDRFSIPWDHSVEIFEAGPGIVVNVREMTLRKAVECFRDMPEHERWGYGVGVHDSFLTTINGRPVAIGFLNASTLTQMIDLLPTNDGS